MKSLRAWIAVMAVVSTACAEEAPPPAAPAPPPPPPPVAAAEPPPPPPAPEKKLVTITTKSPDAKAALLRTWGLIHNNRSEEALASCKQALAADPDFALAHAAAGRLMTGADAQAEMDKAMQLSTNLPEAERLFIEGNASFRRHEMAKYAADFERVAELAPDDFHAQTWLGIVRDTRHDFDGAMAAYARVLELYPAAAYAHGRIAGDHAQRREWDAALASARKYVEGAPDEPWAHQSVAAALLNLGQIKEADAEMARAVEIAPKVRSPYYDLATIKAVEGDFAGARDALERSKAAEVLPSYSLFRESRTAWAELAEGKTKEAFAVLDASEKDADARKLHAPAEPARTRAWALWLLGKPAEAIKAADAGFGRCERPELIASYRAGCTRDLLTVKTLALIQARRAPDARQALAKLQEDAKGWSGDARGQAVLDVLSDEVAALEKKDAKVSWSATLAKCPPDDSVITLSVLRQAEAAHDKAAAEQARKDLLARARLEPAYPLVVRVMKR
jgi:Flp pilus assembly protein TadD